MELTNETRQELSAICEEAIEAAKYAQHMFNTGTHSEALLVANNLVGVFMNIAKDVHGAILIAALEEGAKPKAQSFSASLPTSFAAKTARPVPLSAKLPIGRKNCLTKSKGLPLPPTTRPTNKISPPKASYPENTKGGCVPYLSRV